MCSDRATIAKQSRRNWIGMHSYFARRFRINFAADCEAIPQCLPTLFPLPCPFEGLSFAYWPSFVLVTRPFNPMHDTTTKSQPQTNSVRGKYLSIVASFWMVGAIYTALVAWVMLGK
jgi:hypothetical protein